MKTINRKMRYFYKSKLNEYSNYIRKKRWTAKNKDLYENSINILISKYIELKIMEHFLQMEGVIDGKFRWELLLMLSSIIYPKHSRELKRKYFSHSDEINTNRIFLRFSLKHFKFLIKNFESLRFLFMIFEKEHSSHLT